MLVNGYLMREIDSFKHRLHACLVIAATGWGGGEVKEPIIDWFWQTLLRRTLLINRIRHTLLWYGETLQCFLYRIRRRIVWRGIPPAPVSIITISPVISVPVSIVSISTVVSSVVIWGHCECCCWYLMVSTLKLCCSKVVWLNVRKFTNTTPDTSTVLKSQTQVSFSALKYTERLTI